MTIKNQRGFTQHLAWRPWRQSRHNLLPEAKDSKLSAGFTTIELVIVFVVIVILSSVIYVNYHSLRLKERDSQRKDDIVKLQRELESYQAEFGYYPTLGDMNNSSWRGQNLKGFDSSILEDPLGTAPQLVSAPIVKAYAYQPAPNGCDNSSQGKLCTAYTLTATLESGGTYVQKNFN